MAVFSNEPPEKTISEKRAWLLHRSVCNNMNKPKRNEKESVSVMDASPTQLKIKR